MASLMDDVFLRAEEFVALLKEWLFEIRTRCNETEESRGVLQNRGTT